METTGWLVLFAVGLVSFGKEAVVKQESVMSGLFSAIPKVRDILGPQSIWRVLGLVLLMFLSAAAELLAVVSFVPFAAVVAQPTTMDRHPEFASWATWIGLHSPSESLLFLGVVIIVLFVLSSALKACTHWACSSFAWLENEKLSQELLGLYLSRPFSWYLGRNSSDLTRDIVSEVSLLVEHVLMKILVIISRTLVGFFIAAGIFAAAPMVALLTVSVLGLVYAAIYGLLRRKLVSLGQQRLQWTQKIQKVVSEAFSSIKEAKTTLDQGGFQFDHRSSVVHLRKLMVYRDVTAEIPILLAETLAVATILAVASYFFVTQGEPERAVTLSVLYMAATIRLTPVLQSIYTNLVSLKFYLPVLDRVHSALTSPREELGTPLDIVFEKAVRFSGVDFTYPGASQSSLRNIDLSIAKNSCVGLVGPTGGGKTTIADILAGLLIPSEGKLIIDEAEIGSREMGSWKSRVAYVPQEIYLCDEPVWKNIALGFREPDVDWARVEKAARIAKIHDFIVQELADGYQTILGERGINLSGGQRQRIGIARALYREPDVLILDEATSALDSATERAVMETVEQLAQQKTILVIAHRLSTVARCDVIYVVRDGEIEASGSFEALSAENETFRELL